MVLSIELIEEIFLYLDPQTLFDFSKDDPNGICDEYFWKRKVFIDHRLTEKPDTWTWKDRYFIHRMEMPYEIITEGPYCEIDFYEGEVDTIEYLLDNYEIDNITKELRLKFGDLNAIIQNITIEQNKYYIDILWADIQYKEQILEKIDHICNINFRTDPVPEDFNLQAFLDANFARPDEIYTMDDVHGKQYDFYIYQDRWRAQLLLSINPQT